MSIRFQASGDFVRRTTNVPDDIAFTACGWAMCHDLSANGVLIGLENNTSSATAGIYALFSTDVSHGLSLTSGGSFGVGSYAMKQQRAFFFAFISSGITADLTQLYIREEGAKAVGLISSIGGSRSNFTPSALFVGNDSFGEFWRGDMWAVKVWNRALRQTELEAESRSERPVSLRDLNFYWRLSNAFDFMDKGFRGRNATRGGAPVDGVETFRFPSRIRRRAVDASVSAAAFKSRYYYDMIGANNHV